jgi:hypothetical protein
MQPAYDATCPSVSNIHIYDSPKTHRNCPHSSTTTQAAPHSRRQLSTSGANTCRGALSDASPVAASGGDSITGEGVASVSSKSGGPCPKQLRHHIDTVSATHRVSGDTRTVPSARRRR